MTGAADALGYEWAVVRLVWRVHAQEFCNVGVIVHARTTEVLDATIEPDWPRVLALWPDLDRATAERHLEAFLLICRGVAAASPIALLPPSERFHWLTAPRSAVVQTSPVAQGRCLEPRATLERLFAEQCR